MSEYVLYYEKIQTHLHLIEIKTFRMFSFELMLDIKSKMNEKKQKKHMSIPKERKS